MSYPNRNLFKRNLPPLSNTSSIRNSRSNDNKMPSESEISQYLNSNPAFLEKLINQHMNPEKLLELIEKKERERKQLERHYSDEQVLIKGIPELCNKLNEIEQLNELQEDNHELQFKRRKSFSTMIEEFKKMVPVDFHRIYLFNKDKTSLVENNSNKEFKLSGNYVCTNVAHSRKGFIQNGLLLDIRFSNYGDLKDKVFGSALVLPIIIQPTNELIGVLELYRNDNTEPFIEAEKAILFSYSMLMTYSLFYTEQYVVNKNQGLNSFIMDAIKDIFNQFTDLDDVIKEIMESVKRLVNAERVTLFILDKENNLLYGRLFDLGTYGSSKFEKLNKNIRFSIHEGIAGHVANTGHTVNVSDAYADARFSKKLDSLTKFKTRTILAIPLKVDEEIIGVVQMLNKKDGLFTKNDEDEFSTFAKYCGLALDISLTYGELQRSQEKHNVTMDVLSYPNVCTRNEYLSHRRKKFPADVAELRSLEFWPWKVDKDRTVMNVFHMFEDMFDMECFERNTILRFIITVRKNHRIVPYHNWSHAFSVIQTIYAFLVSHNQNFDATEKLALFLGCMCHDLDYQRKTNHFMVESSSSLSNLYSTSLIESHHYNMTVSILQREGHNVFQSFPNSNYRDVMSKIKHCIVATDLSRYIESKTDFEVNKNTNVYDFKIDWSDSEMRMKYMAFTMTFCDLSAMFKAWEMQLVLAFTIMEEFWGQGDEERKNKTKPVLMKMDRQKRLEMPKLQLEFFDLVCMPCYQLVKYINPDLKCLVSVVQRALDNRNRWYELSVMNESNRSNAIHHIELATRKFISDNNINL